MPESQYETLPDTVLAYKKDHKIGRFDPAAPEIQERKVKEMWDEVERRSKSDAISHRDIFLPPSIHRLPCPFTFLSSLTLYAQII